MNEQRLKEIIEMAYKLGWIKQEKKGYPTMQLSEIEKCMTALYDDFEMNRMKEWCKQK